MSSPINNNNNNGAGSNNSSNANSRNVSPATTPPPILPATTSPIPHNNPMNTPNNNNININNNNSNTNGIPIAVASVPPPLSRNRPVLPNTAYNSIVPPPPSMIASGGGVAAPPPLKSTSTSPYLVNNNNNVHHVGAQFVPPSTTNVVRGPPPYTRQVEFSPTVTLHHPGMPSGSISMNNLNAASSGSNINRSAAVSSSSTSVAASGSMDLPPPPPARRRALSREEIEIEKRKRRQVKRACINCKFAHAACDDQRPCKRCVKNNLENSCIDVERKNKRKKSRREELLSLGLPFVGLDQNVFSLLDSVLPLDRVAAMLQQQQQLQQLQLAAQPAQGQQGQQQSQQQAPLQPPQPTQVQVPIIPQGQPQPQIPIPEIKTEDTSQLNNNNNTIQASINNNNNNSSIASTNNSNNNNVSNNNNNPPEQFQQHFLHPIASNELLFESLFANSAPSSPSRSRSNSINALLSCYNNALLAPPEIFSPTSKRLIDDLPFFPNILEGDDAAHNLDDASANNNNNGTNTATTPAAPSPAIPPSELIARHRAASFGFSAGMLAENERQKQEIKELKRVIADMTEALRSGGKYVAASPSAELFPAHVCVALWKLDGTLYSGNDAFFDAFKVPRASASRSRAMSSASLFGLSSNSSNGNTTTPTTHYRNIVHPQAMNEVSMIFSQLASPSFTRPTNNNMVISGVIRFVEYTPDLNSHFDSLTPQQKQQMSQINEANERQWSHLRVIRSHIQCNLLTDQFGQGQHIIAYLIPLHSAHPYRIPTQPPPQQQHQQPQPMAYKPQPQPQQQQQQQHQQQQHPQPQQQAQPVATPMAGMQPQQQQQQHLQQQQSQQQQQQQGQSPSQQPTTQL